MHVRYVIGIDMPLMTILGLHSMIVPKGRIASFSMGKHPKGMWPEEICQGQRSAVAPVTSFLYFDSEVKH